MCVFEMSVFYIYIYRYKYCGLPNKQCPPMSLPIYVNNFTPTLEHDNKCCSSICLAARIFEDVTRAH